MRKRDIGVCNARDKLMSHTHFLYHIVFGTRGHRPLIAYEGSGSFIPVSAASLKFIIGNQKEHYRKQTFKEEYESLLRLHKIDFDERYLGD
jgi:hypothetical protein